MRAAPRLLPWLTAAFVLLGSTQSSARRTNPLAVFPPKPEELRAVRYSNFSAEQCRSELVSRQVPFSDAGKLAGVDTPVSLEGSLHGVRFEFARAVPGVAHKDVLDCRLLLALDDLAGFAAQQDIALVRYNSIYRRTWARGRLQGHLGGVAIDIVEFVKRDGSVLNVRKDFAGSGIGSVTCGGRAKAATGKASELRRLVCALDEARVFNLLLTPHYDRRHYNHFHFEVRHGIRWFLTQ